MAIAGVIAKNRSSRYRCVDREWVKTKNPDYCTVWRSEKYIGPARDGEGGMS